MFSLISSSSRLAPRVGAPRDHASEPDGSKDDDHCMKASLYNKISRKIRTHYSTDWKCNHWLVRNLAFIVSRGLLLFWHSHMSRMRQA